MTPLRTLLAWLVLLVVGFTNGVVRQLAYGPPRLPDDLAHQLSTFTAVVALGVAVWLLTRAWPLASPAHAWRTGVVWLVLTVLFETGMGLAAGHPLSYVLADYAIWRGRLWPLVLVFLLVAPRLALALATGRARR